MLLMFGAAPPGDFIADADPWLTEDATIAFPSQETGATLFAVCAERFEGALVASGTQLTVIGEA